VEKIAALIVVGLFAALVIFAVSSAGWQDIKESAKNTFWFFVVILAGALVVAVISELGR